LRGPDFEGGLLRELDIRVLALLINRSAQSLCDRNDANKKHQKKILPKKTLPEKQNASPALATQLA
jgi:fatty acid-binding protein DegV